MVMAMRGMVVKVTSTRVHRTTTATTSSTRSRAVATSSGTRPCEPAAAAAATTTAASSCRDQDIVVVIAVVVFAAAAGRALKGRIVLVHDDALAAVAEAAIVLGLEARDVLLQFGDRVVGAAAYAGAAEDDHAAHGDVGWLNEEGTGFGSNWELCRVVFIGPFIFP